MSVPPGRLSEREAQVVRLVALKPGGDIYDYRVQELTSEAVERVLLALRRRGLVRGKQSLPGHRIRWRLTPEGADALLAANRAKS